MTMPNTATSANVPSVAQKIWSDPTCLLLIFAGGSAEFAVHPNVDWLFFTGKLPSDPIGRFFSTIDYLRQMLIVTADQREPLAKSLRGLHKEIEDRRGDRIPDVAYRDVLSMDIYYSIAAADLVFKQPLSPVERDEVVAELVMFGSQMGIPDLPRDYTDLCEIRRNRFDDYGQSEFTGRLLTSYRTALG
ncbi:MAG: oxygenase MpaB family protein, partial [Planctomycetaceae bacterium]